MSSIYPLVSWQVTVPTFTITVLAGSSSEVLTVTGGTYWGWLTSGAVFFSRYDATNTSLAGVIGSTLNTHTKIVTLNAYYSSDISTPSSPLLVAASGPVGYTIQMTITGGSTWQITATSNSAALALFGLAVNDICTGTTGLNNTIINRRTAGVWRPKFAPPAQLEPTLVAVGSGAMSEYNAGTQDRLLFGGRMIWSVVWEYTEAADISRELLTVADYLPTALRATGDTAGTLDDLLWTLARGAQVQLALPPIGTAAVDYRTVVMDVSGSIERGSYTTESATAARRYNVTLALVETQDYDPGTPA
jgi:hypothetical protein